jgi:hypothetical protein
MFHIGPVYRYPKTAESPFNFGERVAFVEAYYISGESDAYKKTLIEMIDWSQHLIIKKLGLLSIEVDRPRYGNFALSEGATTVETILPGGRTFCTGMVYRQGNVLTRAFTTKEQDFSKLWSAHCAITDNLVYSYLACCADSKGFCFHSFLVSHDVLISFHSDALSRRGAEAAGAIIRAAGLRVLFDERNSRKAYPARKRFLRQGIPILVVTPAEFTGYFLVTIRSNPEETLEVHMSAISEVCQQLDVHDRLVHKRLHSSMGDRIKTVGNLGDLKTVIADGRVARFGLARSELKVARLASHLERGEVLGFARNVTDTPPCILDGSRGVWCYASRRI